MNWMCEKDILVQKEVIAAVIGFAIVYVAILYSQTVCNVNKYNIIHMSKEQYEGYAMLLSRILYIASTIMYT